MVLALFLTILMMPVPNDLFAQTATGPLEYLQDPQQLPATHIGASSVTQAVDSGVAQPISLAQADFDQDGIEDLAIGYVTSGGGIIGLRKGNLDAFAPQSHVSWQNLAQGRFPSPFSSSENVFSTPQSPDFLVAGRFTGLGHDDLVIAAQGSSNLYVLKNNGQLQLSTPQPLAVTGAITVLAASRFGSQSRYSTLLVGVTNPQQSSLLVFTGTADGLSLSATYVLPVAASAITFGDMDGDLLPDAVINAGGQVLILHSGAAANPKLEAVSLPLYAKALIVGSFVHDRAWRQQMAILGTDGSVSIVAHGGFDPRGWTRPETLAMWDARVHRRPNPYARSILPTYDGWQIVEIFPSIAPFSANTPLLYRGRISAQGADDIMLMNGDSNQIALISHARVPAGASTFVPGQVSTRSYLSGVPIGGLSARVNIDARPGMIVLNKGQATVSAMMPLPDPTFTVNTTSDTADVNPGDGICADANGQCSLRAAIMEANANANASDPTNPANTQDTIMVPAGTFSLTIPYVGTFDASSGHLDINDGVNIVGEGPGQTIIQANNNDQVFSILDLQPVIAPDPGNQGPGIAVSISNLSISGGQASGIDFFNLGGGAIAWDAGLAGTGTLSLNSVYLNGNSSATYGGALALSDFALIPGSPVTISNSLIQSNNALSGGGGIATNGPLLFTMSNSQVLGNSVVDVNAADNSSQQGGGLLLFSTAPAIAEIHSSTISGNTAGNSPPAQGGGVWTNQGLTIDQGSTIKNNVSAFDGGGFWSSLTNTADIVNILGCTVIGNHAAASGGGLQIDQTNLGTTNVSFSRIVSNSSSTGGNGMNVALNSGSEVADDNWWGCNQGPTVASDGCDSAVGVTVKSNIQFGSIASPSTLLVGATAQLSAGFQSANPQFINTLDAFVGLPVAFGNPVNGALSNIQTSIQSTGAATATFTASASGVGTVQATVDNQTSLATLAVQDFAISVSASSVAVNAGTAASKVITVSVSGVSGFSGTVALAANVSAGANSPAINLSQSSIPVSGSATLTITTTANTLPGAYAISVTGTAGTISHSNTVTFLVGDFSISATPATLSVNAGQSSGSFTITGTPLNGFNGSVALASSGISGLPSGATASFSSSQITVADGSSTNTTGLTIATLNTTPAGNYPLTVTATSGGISHTVKITLSVSSFSLGLPSTQSSTQTITAGSTAVFNLFGQSLNGFAGVINLSAASSGIQPTLSSASLTIPSSGQAPFTVSIATSLNSLPGSYTITVAGGNGSITSSISLTLVVNPPPPDFQLSVDQSSESVLAGQFASYNVTALPVGGFNTALLSASSTVSPAGPTLNTFSNGSGIAKFTVSATAPNTVPATYTITMTVSGGGILHQISMTMNVVQPDFTFTGGGSQTVNQGASTGFPYSLSNVNVNAATISISVTGVPAGVTASASPNQFLNAGSGSLTINTSASATPGTYPMTIWAAGGGVTHTLAANLTISGFSFSIGTAGSISPGGSTTIPFSVTNMVGSFGSVSVSVSGLPSGSTSTLTNGTLFGPGSGNLTINTTSATPAGSYPITFTATGGGFTHTASTTLTITAPPPKTSPGPTGCATIGLPKC